MQFQPVRPTIAFALEAVLPIRVTLHELGPSILMLLQRNGLTLDVVTSRKGGPSRMVIKASDGSAIRPGILFERLTATMNMHANVYEILLGDYDPRLLSALDLRDLSSSWERPVHIYVQVGSEETNGQPRLVLRTDDGEEEILT